VFCYKQTVANAKAQTMKNANVLTAEQQARAHAWRAKANAEYVKQHGMTLDQAEAMEKFFND
jgi:hypothetical protein